MDSMSLSASKVIQLIAKRKEIAQDIVQGKERKRHVSCEL